VGCRAVGRKARRRRRPHLGRRVRKAKRLLLEPYGIHCNKQVSTQYVASFFFKKKRMVKDGSGSKRTLFALCQSQSARLRLQSLASRLCRQQGTGSPPISSEISKMSRVVPGTWVTIAASRWTVLSFVSTCDGGIDTKVQSYRRDVGGGFQLV
jgi:hypothetical protein